MIHEKDLWSTTYSDEDKHIKQWPTTYSNEDKHIKESRCIAANCIKIGVGSAQPNMQVSFVRHRCPPPPPPTHTHKLPLLPNMFLNQSRSLTAKIMLMDDYIRETLKMWTTLNPHAGVWFMNNLTIHTYIMLFCSREKVQKSEYRNQNMNWEKKDPLISAWLIKT